MAVCGVLGKMGFGGGLKWGSGLNKGVLSYFLPLPYALPLLKAEIRSDSLKMRLTGAF